MNKRIVSVLLLAVLSSAATLAQDNKALEGFEYGKGIFTFTLGCCIAAVAHHSCCSFRYTLPGSYNRVSACFYYYRGHSTKQIYQCP